MDAREAFASVVSFFVQVVEGISRGEPLSLLLAAFAGLALARLILTRWAWFVVKNFTILAFLAWFFYLGSGLVGDRWGHDAMLFSRGAGAALLVVLLVTVVRHAVREGRGSRGARPGRPSKPAARRGGFAMRPLAAATPAGAGWGGSGVAHGVRRTDLIPRKSSSPLRRAINVFDPNEEQGLGTVIAFALVCEFGVVSTGIIAPPRAEVGLAFFILLLTGCIFYLYSTYHRAGKTLVHFGVTSAVAVVASVLFGHFWSNEPLENLLGLGYFASNSYVAAATGIAFSLIVYSRSR